MDDKINAKHHQALQTENMERKNRRKSTYDERRRCSDWISTREANTMTDPVGKHNNLYITS